MGDRTSSSQSTAVRRSRRNSSAMPWAKPWGDRDATDGEVVALGGIVHAGTSQPWIETTRSSPKSRISPGRRNGEDTARGGVDVHRHGDAALPSQMSRM